MRLYALVCIVLTVGSLGYRVAFPRHERVVRRVEALDMVLPVTAAQPPTEAVTPAPGLLTFLTLGAAVLGTVSTLSEGAELCASDACLAARIVERAAALRAEAEDSTHAPAAEPVVAAAAP